MLARSSVWIAMLLCGLSMLMLIGTPMRRIESAIPMMLGIPLLFVGVIGLNPHRRLLLIIGAAVSSTLGMTLGAARVVRAASDDQIGLSTFDARNLSPWWGLFFVALLMAVILGFDLLNRQRSSSQSSSRSTMGEGGEATG